MRRLLVGLGLVVLWSLPGLLSAVTTLLLFPNSPTIGGNVQRFLIVSIAPWWIWVPLTPAIVAFAKRVPVERDHLSRTLGVHVLAAVFCGIAYVCAAAVTSFSVQRQFLSDLRNSMPNVVVRSMPGARSPEPFIGVFRGLLSSRLPIGLIIYATGAGIGMAMHERARRRDRESQAVLLEADLARAELRALQMQLQPHFLFNTLHAISMLIEENPRAASAMIAQLGDLLRETLRLSGTPEVTLRGELDLLRQYLAIEEIRLGDRLRVEIAVPEQLLTLSVPSFLLQPLVENAVRHGIAPRLEPGRIDIRAERIGDRLRLMVSDDGPGFGDMRPAGIGLSATRERLAVRYRNDASLTCTTGVHGGAIVTIEMPVRDA